MRGQQVAPVLKPNIQLLAVYRYQLGGFYMWKRLNPPIDGYSVNECGNVRNDKTGKVLKPILTKNGYQRVCIHQHMYRVHLLVAESFMEKPKDGMQINHKDGNKTNNHVSNLEWCTASENINHAIAAGLKKVKFDNIKKPLPCIQMDLSGNTINEFESIKEAERQTGIDNSAISKACRGIYAQTHGYKWRYAVHNI